MKTKSYPLLALGFFWLGLLVGTLLAMSAQSLAQAVIGAMFALLGGSVVAFLEKLSEDGQRRAAVCLFAISFGALCGLYSGLYVNEYQLLTPVARRASGISEAAKSTTEKLQAEKYLRESLQQEKAALDSKYRNGFVSPSEAYETLKKLTN